MFSAIISDHAQRRRSSAPSRATSTSGEPRFTGAGAGPQPLPVRNLTPERLASAIRAARDDAAVRTRAADLSRRIAREDGTGRASELIEGTLASPVSQFPVCR
jgi:hypothetical protein